MSTITAPEPINVAAFTPELIAELRKPWFTNRKKDLPSLFFHAPYCRSNYDFN